MSGRRRMGRITAQSARRRRQLVKDGRRAPMQFSTVQAYQAAVPKLPRAWLDSVWSDGEPFKAMRVRHMYERAARRRERAL